jgi:hypothetical protein
MEITIKFISDKEIDPKILIKELPTIQSYIDISIKESLEGDERGLPREGNVWGWDIYDGEDHDEEEDGFLFRLEMSSDSK